jgi:hypothetical protein
VAFFAFANNSQTLPIPSGAGRPRRRRPSPAGASPVRFLVIWREIYPLRVQPRPGACEAECASSHQSLLRFRRRRYRRLPILASPTLPNWRALDRLNLRSSVHYDCIGVFVFEDFCNDGSTTSGAPLDAGGRGTAARVHRIQDEGRVDCPKAETFSRCDLRSYKLDQEDAARLSVRRARHFRSF